MSPNEALATAKSLAESLESALRDAESETEALRRFAHSTVLEHAVRRESFNLESVELLERLQGQLAEAPRTPELRRKLEELRRLGKDLNDRDATNRNLASRALVFTQAYLNALLPKAQAYNRYGAATRQAEPVGSVSARS